MRRVRVLLRETLGLWAHREGSVHLLRLWGGVAHGRGRPMLWWCSASAAQRPSGLGPFHGGPGAKEHTLWGVLLAALQGPWASSGQAHALCSVKRLCRGCLGSGRKADRRKDQSEPLDPPGGVVCGKPLQACIGKGGGTPPPPPSRAPSLCPAAVSLTASAGPNGMCNRQ